MPSSPHPPSPHSPSPSHPLLRVWVEKKPWAQNKDGHLPGCWGRGWGGWRGGKAASRSCFSCVLAASELFCWTMAICSSLPAASGRLARSDPTHSCTRRTALNAHSTVTERLIHTWLTSTTASGLWCSLLTVAGRWDTETEHCAPRQHTNPGTETLNETERFIRPSLLRSPAHYWLHTNHAHSRQAAPIEQCGTGGCASH